MDNRCISGGILWVLELIEDHKSAFAYDFRNRFQISYKEIGKTIAFDEALHLVMILMQDPTAWLSASMRKWQYPASYEFIALAATYDIHAAVNSKNKPKPFPRPWDEPPVRKGNTTQNARKILAKARDGDLEWQNKPTPT